MLGFLSSLTLFLVQMFFLPLQMLDWWILLMWELLPELVLEPMSMLVSRMFDCQ